MPLPNNQIEFIAQNAKDKKEVRDIIGLIYKTNIRKKIKKNKEPKSIKEILLKII